MRRTRQLTETLTLVQGDMFESPCRTWTNAVNCVGVMGAGVAKHFKARFPEMFEDYRRRCAAGQLRMGEPDLWLNPDAGGAHVLNFPTKQHWKDPSDWEGIQRGLEQLRIIVNDGRIESLAVPALGCGLGGLAWDEVKHTLADTLSALTIPVELYVPHAPATRR